MICIVFDARVIAGVFWKHVQIILINFEIKLVCTFFNFIFQKTFFQNKINLSHTQPSERECWRFVVSIVAVEFTIYHNFSYKYIRPCHRSSYSVNDGTIYKSVQSLPNSRLNNLVAR